ncbi:MAG: zinc ribbon domain-containing protein [Kordiimonadaceae bacterium]|jgi:hypothetical protein|nr:zinc ribbon domain-containing protein [Kordiimonadaceae bacterium]
MNEDVNYCDQCGAKTRPDAKFCSSCGCALDGVATPNLDTPVKDSTEPEIENNELKGPDSDPAVFSRTLRKAARLSVIILIVGGISYGLVYAGFKAREAYLKYDRDAKLRDLKSKIKTSVNKPNSDNRWGVSFEEDPASGQKIARRASNVSDGELCTLSVNHDLDGKGYTGLACTFEFRHRNGERFRIKFDNDYEIYQMRSRIYGPTVWVHTSASRIASFDFSGSTGYTNYVNRDYMTF